MFNFFQAIGAPSVEEVKNEQELQDSSNKNVTPPSEEAEKKNVASSSSFSSWFTSISGTVSTRVHQLQETLSHQIEQTSTVLAPALKSAADQIAEQIKKIEIDATGGATTPAVKLPWEQEDLPIYWKGYEQELKYRVLSLSAKPEYFTRKKALQQFSYDCDLAIHLLETDARLAKLRFELVPLRVSEHIFWTTYFAMIDNIIHKQQPTHFYIKQLQDAMESGQNLEACIKSAQQLKKQLAEQLFEEADDTYLVQMNEELKKVLTDATQVYYKLHPEQVPMRRQEEVQQAVKKEQEEEEKVAAASVKQEEKEVKNEQEEVVKKQEEKEEKKDTIESADEDVKMPWEE